MSKQTDNFRALGVYNSHGFYNGDSPYGQVYIAWTGGGGRSPIGYFWTVYRVGYKTQPEGGAWYEYGNKTFSGYGDKAEALAQAQTWASSRYGISEWARDPYGCYGEADFVKARIAELKLAVKAVAQAPEGRETRS